MLVGSEWRPIEIQGLDVNSQDELFVQFRIEGGLAGHAGCRFVGSYRIQGYRIEIDMDPSGCPFSIEETETRFVRALETATGFERDRTRLILFDREGHSPVRLIQTDWD